MAQTAGDVLVETLIDWGIDTVFGMPGDGINGIMEALRTRQEKVRFIQVRHEESAAFMACAWAKWTGGLGCCLATEKAAVGMTAGTHGSTYGGNPLACAVGAAVMEVVADDDFLAEVRRKSGLFRQGLEGLVASHPDVFETVRGAGLMLGLKCKVAPADFVKAGYEASILTVPAADNVVRLLPPLNISDEDIAEALRRLDAAASAMTS